VKASIQVGSHTIEVSSRDKEMFPDAGLTKGDVIDYYQRIASVMLPHIKERPLTMQRFPDGLGGGGFYQKAAPHYFPDWVERVSLRLKENQEQQAQVVCNNEATLVYLANQACLTPHIWLSKTDDLDHPDRLVFDLDPPAGDFEPVRSAAKALRKLLEEIGLVPYLMTTGSQGLHLVIPLDRQAGFESAREFGRAVAQRLADQQSDRLTIEISKEKREGRVFLDYLRNAYGQTTVTPYALRALPKAPVATPLDWDELSDPKLHPRRYTMRNIFRRLGQKADPWQNMMADACSLEAARRQLGRR
jgi:bifunctional non-homologous end joining protein LigD